ncbi:hypothetical protein ANO14919_125310 [Xylariales sp. No.14919]|nr:hypothetical protein ANO14919_125310 [Xylariales sp. No.14919]
MAAPTSVQVDALSRSPASLRFPDDPAEQFLDMVKPLAAKVDSL